MAEQVFKKETGWGDVREDFKGKSEIMVTITLHEYRSLVRENAKKEHEESKLRNLVLEAEADRDRWKQRYELLKDPNGGECESDD